MPSDVQQADYFERLWPSPGIWAATIALGAGFGLIPAPVSARAAMITAVLGVVILVTLLVILTPTLRVTKETFAAGRLSCRCRSSARSNRWSRLRCVRREGWAWMLGPISAFVAGSRQA